MQRLGSGTRSKFVHKSIHVANINFMLIISMTPVTGHLTDPQASGPGVSKAEVGSRRSGPLFIASPNLIPSWTSCLVLWTSNTRFVPEIIDLAYSFAIYLLLFPSFF